ncbi:MAG TPA: transglycosylase SLT domain-containing protein [Thermodesulfovibrionales bacterium]|nr:transglycosylase SLT domain-containing protein [Thermodesulfovibrionales bacterium]
MVKKNVKGFAVMVFRKILLVTLVLSCLIVIPGFALVFAARDLAKPLHAVYQAGKMNPVILEWMRNNSGMPEEILSEVYRAAVRNGNADLILAICMVESNFNPKAKSKQGAIGLMGISPWAWLDELKAQGIVREKQDLYQISENIASGAYVLQKYLSRGKTLEKALIDYVGGDPEYARKVMKALGELYLAKWAMPDSA